MRSSSYETAYLATWNYDLLGCNALTACLFCSLRSPDLEAAESGVGFVLLNWPTLYNPEPGTGVACTL